MLLARPCSRDSGCLFLVGPHALQVGTTGQPKTKCVPGCAANNGVCHEELGRWVELLMNC